MRVNFLNGNLIVRNNKSGVHFFHENIMRGLIKEKVEFNSSLFNFINKNTELLDKNQYSWIRNRIVENKYLHRVFVYLLPIELFFGQYDIYICDGWIPITKNKSIKISVVHDLMSKIYPENYKPLMKLYLHIFFKKLKRSDLVIAVSETTKSDIIKYLKIPENKIKVVYNGINIDYVNRVSQIETEEKVDLSKKYILYIGEMRKNKNLMSAIKAFEKYCDRNDEEIYFYIAGKKAFEYENIENYIKGKSIEKRIIFLGYVSEPLKMRLYKNAFAFIFVSLYEGFGIPILEAMACKTPVITSNCSSMKEIADNSAILVSPKNIDDICGAIEKLSDFEFRKSIVEKGFLCSQKYTWNDAVLRFKNILESYEDNSPSVV